LPIENNLYIDIGIKLGGEGNKGKYKLKYKKTATIKTQSFCHVQSSTFCFLG